MHHPIGQPTFPQDVPYQQPHMINRQDVSRPFQQQQQQQQYGPRFPTPQQLTPPRPFYQPPLQYHNGTRLPYQGSLQPPHYQSANSNFDLNVSKPPFQPPAQNFETLLTPTSQLPIQNFETPPNPQYSPLSVGPGFNQPSSPFRAPVQTYDSPVQNYNQHPIVQNLNQPPPIPNYNQPPPIQSYNQPPVQNYNNHSPIHHFNQPPPALNYNQPFSPPFKSLDPSGNQSVCSPQSSSPGYGPPPNVQYQPQVHSTESLKQSFSLPRPEFNQRPPFRAPGLQRFPFNNNQHPRSHRPQQGGNRYQFHPRHQYQNNYQTRGPFPGVNNQSKDNIIIPKKDKIQVACKMGECDFVGHPSAVKEHQNLHHRLGLHKKVLYSNNSDAVKTWIQERRKKWPTKETIQLKLEVEEEKNKRGERIADEDFQRFNKNSKLHNSGSKRSNNRKRPKLNGTFVDPTEELMNGNLKRFAGITEVKKKNDIVKEISKPVASKLLVEYDESSDDEPPEETSIVKESASQEKFVSESNNEPCSPTSNISGVLTEHNEVVNTKTLLTNHDNQVVGGKVMVESNSTTNNEREKTNTEQGQKRKKSAKKEFKLIKKTPPLRTPRTEIVERKSALLEALMGDLMRSERNAITQCICYIRNNMHRFCKIQAA